MTRRKEAFTLIALLCIAVLGVIISIKVTLLMAPLFLVLCACAGWWLGQLIEKAREIDD